MMLAIAATPSPAQRSGFRAGIAHPSAGYPPTQAPAVAVRGGTFSVNPNFFTVPIAPIAPVVVAPQFVVPGQQFVFPGQSFLIPGQPFATPQQFLRRQRFANPVFIPSQPFFPNPAFLPSPVIVGPPAIVSPPVIVPNHILVPGQTFVPPPAVITPVPGPVVPTVVPVHPSFVPLVGMPRTQVIQELGHPSVSVITSRGEVLQFTGGLTVVIENGKVVRTR
jgi:hypothetical protein